MKAKALLTAVLAVALAGCVLRGKPAKTAAVPATPKPAAPPAPALPPAPLSIPQTHVALPAPQALDPAAFDVEPIPEPQPVIPVPPRSHRPSPPAATPPAVATPALEPRETVQEIVPPAELKHLKDLVQSRRQEVNKILVQVGRRKLTAARQNTIATIKSFLALSEEAENHNDMRQADGFAERAWILAKELQSGQ